MRELPSRAAAAGRESGIALVIVLWLIMVLAVQVGLLNRSLRSGIRIVDNATAVARGEALMHSVVELAASRLTSGDPRTRWRADESQRSLEIAGSSLTLTISDENGRINLNLADGELIAGLLRTLALSPADVALVTDRILDWRDPDRERRRSGAEDAEYKRAGLEYGAADEPFLDTSDLVRVLGVSRALLNQLLPHLTIYTKDGLINPRVASRQVLFALPDVKRETVEMAYDLYRKGNEQALVAHAMLAPAKRFLADAIGPVYRIRFEIGGARRGALGSGEAIVALGLDAAVPYRVLAWRFSPSTARASTSID